MADVNSESLLSSATDIQLCALSAAADILSTLRQTNGFFKDSNKICLIFHLNTSMWWSRATFKYFIKSIC